MRSAPLSGAGSFARRRGSSSRMRSGNVPALSASSCRTASASEMVLR